MTQATLLIIIVNWLKVNKLHRNPNKAQHLKLRKLKKILSTKLVMLLHNTLIVTLTGSFTLIA